MNKNKLPPIHVWQSDRSRTTRQTDGAAGFWWRILGTALLVLVATTGTVSAVDVSPALVCTMDAFETDDTFDQAKPIVSGVTKNHSICPAGDQDWSMFTLAATSAVTLETSGPAFKDTKMSLHDAGEGLIEENDDGGTNFYSLIDRECGVDALAAGTYFVKVFDFFATFEIPSYNLDLTAAVCAGCAVDLVLANTTLAGTQTHEATSTATLGPALIVNGTNVVVNAPTVVFVGGVEVGGTFRAGNTTSCT